MKLGIGLPATIPNTPPELVLDWAKRADERGFSSLGIIDRLVYELILWPTIPELQQLELASKYLE